MKDNTTIDINHAQHVQNEALKRAEIVKSLHTALVTNIYTADPSAHVFDGTLYVYPSHDIESTQAINDNGDQYAMKDYHVLSIDEETGRGIDHGVALSLDDIAWAKAQLWAPDAAKRNNTFYLFFPAKAHDGIFRIGVAVSDSPTGPFTPKEQYIQGTSSIDPAVFEDDDGQYYLYYGGLWGGQLQDWKDNHFEPGCNTPSPNAPALPSKVARLNDDMTSLAEPAKDVIIVDEQGEAIVAGDNQRRFFEASWVHKHQGVYYFSYSTGDTHNIAYATGDNPYGPFTYRGVILGPVLGWTNHHSIVCHGGTWWLFYHDSSLSGGQSHLRCVKMAELTHNKDGSINTVEVYQSK